MSTPSTSPSRARPPPGARVWAPDANSDEPIRILNPGAGPFPYCGDEIQMAAATRQIRGTCPCGWETEFAPMRRHDELRALTAAHVDAAVQRYVREGVYTVEAFRELMSVADRANRRSEFDGIIAALDGAYAGPALDWGEPLSESDANWPDDASQVCAHICGGDHECDVRATTSLTYALPSGGKRTMPMCATCKAAEVAEATNA